MKKILLLLVCVMATQAYYAQLQVGHTTITFNDAARTGGFGSGGGTGRQIQTEIYYPAAVAGNDVALASGKFPVIVFGHGFAMAWDAYQNIWEKLAKEGYIIAFPRTEGGLIPSPSHAEFGKDLALVVDKMLALNSTPASLFENKIIFNVAIMGHSMGGGATFLAAANNTSIKTVVGLAPAETNPSAAAAAANITVPTLILSGTSDLVTPPADNHTLIYNGLTSNCKFQLNLIGGGHCLYANTNTNCDFGESTSSPAPTLTRAQQQAIMFDYILPWFAYHLKLDCNAWDLFFTPQATDTRITAVSDCPGIQVPQNPTITLGNNVLTSSESSNNQWYKDGVFLTGETNVDLPLTYGSGSYTVVYMLNPNCYLTSDAYDYTAPTTTGVEELTFDALIYPNPTNESFQVQISNGQPFEASMYSIDGKFIQSNTGVDKLQIESSDWKSGVYLVVITQGNTKITKRVSKR